MVSRKFLPLPECALALGVPYQNARDLMLRGVLLGEKVGARWLVSRESLDRELARRRSDG